MEDEADKHFAKMRADGFKEVYELQGGIMKWRGANLPETTSTVVLAMGMSKQHYDSLLVSDKLVLIDFYADWCAPCKNETLFRRNHSSNG